MCSHVFPPRLPTSALRNIHSRRMSWCPIAQMPFSIPTKLSTATSRARHPVFVAVPRTLSGPVKGQSGPGKDAELHVQLPPSASFCRPPVPPNPTYRRHGTTAGRRVGSCRALSSLGA
ncbi:hypothetical protein NXT3_PC00266 (plasmid) [Sinorhizobium fredii]|uniref:Uncharacterized protein n=1 Tax=Rhizobium fredii TaxID=380 RepID=A0A2L0HF83_RHIFR|nr:hypothetical protein NXT3_PC00266 [Sinorhizobium fredii]